MIRILIAGLAALMLTGTADSAAIAPHSRQYARWTSDAREAVRIKYPKASAVDFQYVGCEARSRSVKQFAYKYWMKERQGREFGVYAIVVADVLADRALSAKTEETAASSGHERWRNAAVAKVKQRYPDYAIYDANPYDCLWHANRQASQGFSFWLKDREGKSKFLIVTVRYDADKRTVVAVDVRERNVVLGRSR